MINWWQIWAIVLAVWNAGNLVCAVLALVGRYRYKAENEQLHAKIGGQTTTIRDQAQRNASMVVEITDLQLRVEAILQDRDELEVANSELGLENDTLKAQLDDALIERDKYRLQLDEATKQSVAATRKRTKKADPVAPLSQE